MTPGRRGGDSDPDDVDDAPIETLRSMRDELERLAETDLPIAPYAQNGLDRLEEADRE